MDNLKSESLKAHKKFKGKLSVVSKVPLKTKKDLSLYYTPGVAFPCKEIENNPKFAYEYTCKSNMIAVVTDGSAVLGLGNIGALAGLPVMEGKCVLFKIFGGIDAVPICLDTQDTDKIIEIVKAIAPSFGGINLEDISAPRCFEIEKVLSGCLDIPVFHDDQHGTAIVCLAGLINALKVVKKDFKKVAVVVNGAGAAGIAITKLLLKYGFKNISLVDSKGLIYEGRDDLNEDKNKISKVTNLKKSKGDLKDAIKEADVFVGVSKPNLLKASDVKLMNKDPVIFAMANPDPEIAPKEAKKGGAKIIATGRSDYPNQINNALIFPGFFKGLLKGRIGKITDEMKIAAAKALAAMVKNPTAEKIIPKIFDKGVADKIARAVMNG